LGFRVARDLSHDLKDLSGGPRADSRLSENSEANRAPPAKSGTRSTSGAPGDGTTITNTLGMKLALIRKGEFLMGSLRNEKSKIRDESPRHRVRITKPFYLGVHEVTRGQFRRFVEATQHRTDAERDPKGNSGWNEQTKQWERNPGFNWRNPGFEQTDEHPVVFVSWNDAQAFLAWLSAQERRTYRLPTEAEWEFACRAGTTTPYSSDDMAAVGNFLDATTKALYSTSNLLAPRDGHPYTAPVGSFKPNAFQLFDMQGNVQEWCSDGYDADYYDRAPAPRDRFGLREGKRLYYERVPVDDPPGASGAARRVVRGGGWNEVWSVARSARRYSHSPEDRSNALGFRVLLVQSAR
jgi:formylglycine-generating enzyme required for sulfatase activity